MRNVLSTLRGMDRRSDQDKATVSRRASMNPMTGAMTMKINVLVQPLAMMAENPVFATAAPAYPPISACDDDVGRASHHVTRSQMMAPSRPASATVESTMVMSISPLPTVLAIAVPQTHAPTTVQTDAHTTAALGERRRTAPPRT